MKCFKCERDLSVLSEMPSNPDGAGEFVLSFHYGSEWDQMGDWVGRPSAPDPDLPRHQNLLRCSQIRGYVCDRCFEAAHHLLDGWVVERSRPTERKVV